MPNQTNNQNQPKSSGSSTAIIVAVIILVGFIFLMILGVGGYFAWKYFSKKSALKEKSRPSVETQIPNAISSQTQSSASSAADQAASQTTGNFSSKTKTLENLFKYPNAYNSKTKYNTDYNAKIFIDMSTYDNLDTVYNFYETLVSVNNWNLGSQGYSTGGSSAWINIEEKDFRAEVTMNYGGGITAVTANVYFENNAITFSQIKSTVVPVDSGANYSGEAYDPETVYYDYAWQSEYVIPGSDSYEISESELWSFTPWQLKVARNEIYARHGRKFVHKDMSCYFSRQSWYYVNPNFSESDLSNVENKNVATILRYEEKIKSPLLRKDSGCHD